MNDFEKWLDREPAGPKPRRAMPRGKPMPRATQRIAPVGAKAKRTAPKYRATVLAHLAEFPTCQIGPIIKAAGYDVLCLDTAVAVHHRKGRGKYLCDRATLYSACAGECHLGWVHDTHVKEAYELGLLLTR